MSDSCFTPCWRVYHLSTCAARLDSNMLVWTQISAGPKSCEILRVSSIAKRFDNFIVMFI